MKRLVPPPLHASLTLFSKYLNTNISIISKMKRTTDTYREYLNTGREYEDKIVYLEQRVDQLESANKILNEFSLNASNIIFKMDCLLVKKGEKISSLMEQIENLSKNRNIIETDTHEPEIIGRSRSNSEVKGQIKLEFAREDDENLISKAHIVRDTQHFQGQDREKAPEDVLDDTNHQSKIDFKMEVIDEDFLEVIDKSNSDLRIEEVDYDWIESNVTEELPGIPDIRRAFSLIFNLVL